MKLNIGVIFGGVSVEHEISVISAHQVINALDKEKYNVIPIYISKDQDFYFENSYFDIKTFTDLSKAVAAGVKVVFKKVQSKVEMHYAKNKLFSSKMKDIDIFFPVMHGTNGEDGKLQGMLEMLDATFVGPDTKSAVNGQDKVFMKSILAHNGIKIVDFEWLYKTDYYENEDDIITSLIKKLHFPMIIKPASLGSSIGISKANNIDKLKEAIDYAFQYDTKILIEKVIDNLCEVNCAVLGDYSEQITSDIEEVFQSDEFLSYEDKYQSKGSKGQGMAATKRVIPANIDTELTSKVKTLAIDGFKVLNLSGNTRIDFLIDKNTREVYLNETNTIPGSLAFYMWESSGMPFSELCDRLIKLAIKRKREEAKNITTFSTNVLENFDGSKTSKKMG
ncbi:D-alanine--D-alanine ligase [Erysipelotrichaceae bacterium OttesenSCG-928-M19]|nr:D-alanine--D-alanine ligase [Erysipelotrichaceae bacterium OttesenSCG-928-M19]